MGMLLSQFTVIKEKTAYCIKHTWFPYPTMCNAWGSFGSVEGTRLGLSQDKHNKTRLLSMRVCNLTNQMASFDDTVNHTVTKYR